MELKALLLDTHAHIPPLAALGGLSADRAAERAAGAPHSIGEIVAHLVFWQEWFCRRCRGEAVPMAARAADGWPGVGPGDWPALRARFAAGLEDAVSLSADAAACERVLDPRIEPLGEYTVRDALLHIAQHNAHHLGQVVLLRQLQGSWPPPAGSWTW